MSFSEANGIAICWDRFGPEDGAPLLLISGLGSQMIRWPEPFCEELGRRGFRVIRFDNRDIGLSTHFRDTPPPDAMTVAGEVARGLQPNVPYTLLDLAADAIGLMDALSIPQAHLVGRSMGGMIAQLVASEYPERVLSLTSVMSITGNPALPGAAPDVMAMLMQRAADPFADVDGYLAHRIAFGRRTSSPGYPFDEETYRAMILEEISRGYDPGGFGRQLAAIAATGDCRPALSRIMAPTVVIHGADDPLVPPECGKDVASSIPGAELHLMEGMGHDFPVGVHGKIADLIESVARRQP